MSDQRDERPSFDSTNEDPNTCTVCGDQVEAHEYVAGIGSHWCTSPPIGSDAARPGTLDSTPAQASRIA